MESRPIAEGEFQTTTGKNFALGLVADLWISVLGPRSIEDDEWQEYGAMLVHSTRNRIKLKHSLTIAGSRTPNGDQRRWMFEFLKHNDALRTGGCTTIVTSSAPTLVALKGWNVVSLIMRLDIKHEPFALNQLASAIASCGIRESKPAQAVFDTTIEMVSIVGHPSDFVQTLTRGSP